MSVFFQFVSAFALFFGIAGLVYATEVSKRCQLMIDNRFAEIEADIAAKSEKHETAIRNAVISLRETAKSLEETELAQSREINLIRKMLEPIQKEYEKAREMEEKNRRVSMHGGR